MFINQRTLATAAIAALAFGFAATASNSATTCAEEMTAVKAEWDKAPAGAQKDAALDYYTNAGTAEKAKDEKICIANLDAAKSVLTMKPMTRTAGMLCADDLKLVKAEWDKAKDGPKKDAALVHYTAAEASDKAKKEETCFVHADAAAAALK